MKKKKSVPDRIHTACLPDDIYVSFEYFKMETGHLNQEILQNQSGKNLIKKMADGFLDETNIRILTQKHEKPTAFCREKEVSVSFSHTKDAVAGALSFSFNVGCDMENTGRKVHSRLVDRMKNVGEQQDLYEKTEPIQIWTLKESALKMIGTGLRKPMNSVRIEWEHTDRFDVEFDSGNRAKICSFQHQDHWISICYQELSAV